MKAALLHVALAAFLLAASPALADVTHTVARGHTLDAIAHRYHVTVRAILEANHLKDGRHLRPGDTLVIPGVKDESTGKGKDAKDGKSKSVAASKGPATYATKAKSPGVVHATRLATKEDFSIHVSDKSGKQAPLAEKSFEKMMRGVGGQTHAIDPRLIALVGIVSNHFGSRKLEIVSGFRPYSPTQYTKHSNHNQGKAIDFRVVGVPNEVLRDFCRTLRNTGCGYYPNSVFVHMDVRDAPAYWVDYSRPGEAPKYDKANTDADEGASEVAEDNAGVKETGASMEPSAGPGIAANPDPPGTPAPSGGVAPSAPAAPPPPAPAVPPSAAPASVPTFEPSRS